MNPIKPITRDGKEYYVAYVSRAAQRALAGARAADIASQAFAGRNWRRVKREMNKAYLRAVSASEVQDWSARGT